MRDRQPSLKRQRRRFEGTTKTRGLLVLSGEDLVFDRPESFLRDIHLPLFEAHFGPVWPREGLEWAWRCSSFDRGGGSKGRFVRLASMLSLVSRACEEKDRSADFVALSRSLWSWLSVARSPSTGSLARFIAGRGCLAKSLGPVLSFSVDLDARLRALRPPACRPTLAALRASLPDSVGLAAVTGLPASVVSSTLVGAWWRVWDDGLRCPTVALSSDLGIVRSIPVEEGACPPRFGSGRLLVIGTRPQDRRLAGCLGAEFVAVQSTLVDDALDGLARGFSGVKPERSPVEASTPG